LLLSPVDSLLTLALVCAALPKDADGRMRDSIIQFNAAMKQLASHKIDSMDHAALDRVQKEYLENASVYIPRWARQVLVTVVNVADIEVTERKKLLQLLQDPINPKTAHIREQERARLAQLAHLYFCTPGRRFDFSSPRQEPSAIGWPKIAAHEDVFANPIRRSLRKDVLDYLKTVLLRDIDQYEIHVPPKSEGEAKVSVAVSTEQAAVRVRDRLDETARQDGFLAPGMVIGVHVDARVAIIPVAQGPLITSGSPMEAGTLGGVCSILKDGSTFICGVTARHNLGSLAYDVQQDRLSSIDSDAMGDVALVNLDTDEFQPYTTANLVHFISDENFLQLHLAPLCTGEPVYKIGISTGLTIGTLESENMAEKKVNGNSYARLATVKGLSSFTGDCGALYCVMRTVTPAQAGTRCAVQGFYPFAVHVNSSMEEDDTLAHGLLLWDRFDSLAADNIDFINSTFAVN